MRRYNILVTLPALILLTSCTSIQFTPAPPLREFTEQEKKVLFIKDHIPSDSQCDYLGILSYTNDDNGSLHGCALYSRQSHVFIIKAAKMKANLVVANFSKNDPGTHPLIHDPKTGWPSCKNEAKAFKCKPKALAELKRYE